MSFFTLRAVIFSSTLVLTTSCRHTEGDAGDSDVKEATSTGFRYDNMSLDLVDKNGAPVVGVPVHFSSQHWFYQVAHLPSDLPIFIPIVDPKWVPKEDHRGILGYTDANGHFESGKFSVTSHGILPGTGPATFVFEGKGWFPAACEGGNSDLLLDANVGGLSVVSASPQGSVAQGQGCALNVDAKTDNNKALQLKCRSTLSADEIAKNIVEAKKNCLN